MYILLGHTYDSAWLMQKFRVEGMRMHESFKKWAWHKISHALMHEVYIALSTFYCFTFTVHFYSIWSTLIQVPPMHSLDEQQPCPGPGQRLKTSDKLQEYIQRRGPHKLYRELENYVNQRLSLSLSLGSDGADEMMAIAHQQKEMAQFNKTLKRVHTI